MFNSAIKSKSLMTNPSSRKLGIITVIFFIGGFWGIFMGLIASTTPNFILTALGMVNISLGIFLGFRILRNNRKAMVKRK